MDYYPITPPNQRQDVNYIIMGSTESKADKTRLELQYRLVRRFISDFYGGGQITIIEHKQTKEQVALREVVNQFNPQLLLKQLESRRLLSHQNLIQMRNYWLESDLNICSNLFKLYAIFEYHQNSLEDYLAERSNSSVKDAEVVDFVKQMTTALAYLERNEMVYLLAGPKSVMVAEEEDSSLPESENERHSHNKPDNEINPSQKNSLAQLNRKYFGNDQLKISRDTPCKDHKPLKKKNVYKLFEPFDGLTSTKTFHNLQSYMQVPLHPQLATSSHEQLMLPESLVKLQNMFTVVLIALAMSEGCDIFEVDVMKGGRLSIEKLKKRVEKLEQSHPRTSNELLKIMAVRGAQRDEPFARGGHLSLKLKDFSFIMRREQSRQSQKQNQTPELRASEKIIRTFSRKRISLMHG